MKNKSKDLNNLETRFINSTSNKKSTTLLSNISKSLIKIMANKKGIIFKKDRNREKKFSKNKLSLFIYNCHNWKNQNYLNNLLKNNTIEVLNSNFITENIIASKRKWNINR